MSSEVSNIYPLSVLNSKTEVEYLLWPWQDGLEVKVYSAYKPKPAVLLQTFFVASGDFLPELKTRLPLVFLDWAQTIPLEFRQAVGRLAGNYSQMPQLLILRLMNQNALFSDWIVKLAQSSDGAYLRLMWQLARLENAPLPVQETWLLSLVGQSRNDLLGRMLNKSLSVTQANKVRKIRLDDSDWSSNEIARFFTYLYKPEFVALLGQLHSIRLGALDYLCQLPRWLWTAKLWQHLSEFDNRAIRHVLPPLILEAEPAQQKIIIAQLKKVDSPRSLEHHLMKLADKLMAMLPFPTPPMRGNHRLSPIDSALKLKLEGQTMQHCVGGYVSEVVKGESYFYHWAGDAQLPLPLTLQLQPFPKSSQWQLVEALGFENKEIEPADWDYLLQQLANINRPWGYLLLKTMIVGVGYGDYKKAYPRLKREMRLNIYRETNNPIDHQAIRIDTPQGEKLGYVAREDQAVLNPFLDNNISLNCRLNFLKPDYATVNIYLTPASAILLQ